MIPIQTEIYSCPCSALLYRRTKPTDPPRQGIVWHFDYDLNEWRRLRDGEQQVPTCTFCGGQATYQYDETEYTPHDRILWESMVDQYHRPSHPSDWFPGR